MRVNPAWVSLAVTLFALNGCFKVGDDDSSGGQGGESGDEGKKGGSGGSSAQGGTTANQAGSTTGGDSARGGRDTGSGVFGRAGKSSTGNAGSGAKPSSGGSDANGGTGAYGGSDAQGGSGANGGAGGTSGKGGSGGGGKGGGGGTGGGYNGGGGTSGSGGTPAGGTCEEYVDELRGCGLVTGTVDCTGQDQGTYWPCLFGCYLVAPCGQIQDGLCGQSASNALSECANKCASLTFNCGGGETVPTQFQCDGGEDCSNGKDEANCPIQSGTFSCDNGMSVPSSYRCDDVADCTDGSDEVDCPKLTCPTPAAPPKTGEACTAAQTNLKSCGILPGGIMTSCLDRTENAACQKQCLAKGACDDIVAFFCDDNASSKNPVRLCVNDCLALPDQFSCQKDGTTIPVNWLCDGSDDCSDGTDELDCTFQCKNGDTVPYSYTCDAGEDCSDGSDEVGCGPTCEAPPPN